MSSRRNWENGSDKSANPQIPNPNPREKHHSTFPSDWDLGFADLGFVRSVPLSGLFIVCFSLTVVACSPKRIMGNKDDKQADILQGTLDLLILKTLTRGEMHGYEITEWIHTTSSEALSVEEGALYPALHRLELRGLLSSSWDVSANNRRAKYYRLTAAGRKQLRETIESWRRSSAAVNRIIEAT